MLLWEQSLMARHRLEFKNSRDLELLLSGAALCSNARLIAPEAGSERYTVLGDPTEACLEWLPKKVEST